jgi:hypothetical protein
MAREQRKALINAVEQIRGSRVVCCVTSDRQNAQGVIAKDFIPIVYNHLRGLDSTRRVDVFLFTTGGDTLAAFGISRLLRQFTKDVGALVPEKCHSAGTLLALGANEIFMTLAATLTPIDPSVITQLNPKVEGPAPGSPPFVFPVSVENIGGFEDLVKDEWKLDGDGRAQAFRILAHRVHPLVLGQAYRTREQIGRLATALLKSHRRDERAIKDIVEQLTRKMGSHDYLISRHEAKEILRKQVVTRDPELKLEKAIWALYEDFRDEMELGRIYDPSAVAQRTVSQGRHLPVTIVNRLVTIETTVASDVWEVEMLLTQPPTQPQPPMGLQTPPIQLAVLYNGWRHYE